MILIRGIKGEQYARKIKKGIVDCRDVLSTLLEPPVTGYEFSDYYEKNFVKAAAALYGKEADIHEPEFLYDLMIHLCGAAYVFDLFSYTESKVSGVAG